MLEIDRIFFLEKSMINESRARIRPREEISTCNAIISKVPTSIKVIANKVYDTLLGERLHEELSYLDLIGRWKGRKSFVEVG